MIFLIIRTILYLLVDHLLYRFIFTPKKPGRAAHRQHKKTVRHVRTVRRKRTKTKGR